MYSPSRSSFSSSQTFSSSTGSDFWEMVEKKANEFLDVLNVQKGDPLMKQDRYFAKNKMLVLNIRKSSAHSLDGSSLALSMTYRKKKSCITFEQKELPCIENLRTLKSQEGL